LTLQILISADTRAGKQPVSPRDYWLGHRGQQPEVLGLGPLAT